MVTAIVAPGAVPAAAHRAPPPLLVNDEPSPLGLEVVPPELRAIVELFTSELASVSFPEVDGGILRRQLEDLATCQLEVDRARAALEQAAAALDRRTGELGQLASRGLAYARIYAEAHPERESLHLKLARVDRHDLAAAPEPAVAAPRRGRKRAPRPELPFEPAPPGGDEDASPLRVAEGAR